MNILLSAGERGLIAGQTGSGKTLGAVWQLQTTAIYPVLIFDTKIEDAFLTLTDDYNEIIIVEGLTAFKKLKRKKEGEIYNYIVVRPLASELSDSDLLDEYLLHVYDHWKNSLIYIDELYQWHNQGRAGSGLLGLLTRGRSRKITLLMSTQRPQWVSRFCLTEAQKYYIYRLADGADRRRMSDVIPDYDKLPLPARFHFYFFEHGMDLARLYAPVPYDPGAPKITLRRWV